PRLQAAAGAVGLAVRPLACGPVSGEGSARVRMVPAGADALSRDLPHGGGRWQRAVAHLLHVLGEAYRLRGRGDARLRRGGRPVRCGDVVLALRYPSSNGTKLACGFARPAKPQASFLALD